MAKDATGATLGTFAAKYTAQATLADRHGEQRHAAVAGGVHQVVTCVATVDTTASVSEGSPSVTDTFSP